ncbi:MAG: hypothetical protein K2M47_00695 [Clostridiales bacterium]|nr:hypothetical protein [Clostridiales bacterium]MDE6200387.1 hypothetical protein [Clostridiales bacterium]
MRWFCKLKRKTRVIITVVVWILAVVGCGIVGSTLPDNAESMQPWQAVVVLLCLAVATSVTVVAVIARNREKKAAVDAIQADKEKPAAAQAEADMQRKLQDRRNVVVVMPDGSVVVNFHEGGKKVYTPDEAKSLNIEPTVDAWTDDESGGDIDIDVTIKSGVCLPLHTKAVGVSFDDRQECIKASSVGDVLTIKHTPLAKFPEASIVVNDRTGKTLGSVKKELALQLLDEFGDGFVLRGSITDITGGTDGKESVGCNIEITEVA